MYSTTHNVSPKWKTGPIKAQRSFATTLSEDKILSGLLHAMCHIWQKSLLIEPQLTQEKTLNNSVNRVTEEMF